MIEIIAGRANMIIRSAKLEDLKEIANIENCCFPKAEAASKEALKERIEAFKDCFFVAETEEKIVGFINGCISNDNTIQDEAYESIRYHDPSGKYQMVFGLDVLPDYQHQGIAQRLMYHFIKTAKNRGQLGIVLTCKEHLIGFYEQFGFVNEGKSASTHGFVTWYDMRLLF